MTTTRKGPAPLHFIVLIPHRDGGRIPEEYRRELFASGLAGAFSFPAAAPLALVSRPFSGKELKALAGEMRELSLKEGGEGRFRSAGAGVAACPLGVCRTSCVKPKKIADQAIFYPANSVGPKVRSSPIIGDFLRHQAQKIHKCNRLLGGLRFFGPLLKPWEESLPSLAGDKILYRFPALCLCAAILGPGDVPPATGPELSFRAAMTANLVLRPLSRGERGYSFAWRTGRPVWLPAYKKPKHPE